MTSAIPQWIATALDDALVGIGATADPAKRRDEVDRLLRCWTEHGRAFHNARYLGFVLEQLDKLDGAATDPDALRIALAYRGAQREMGWEELESNPGPDADAPGADTLRALGVEEAQIQRVADLVRQLQSHAPEPDDLDAKIAIDANLAALASPPQQYKKLLQGLRADAAGVDGEEFLRRRRKAVKRLLARRNVFFTPLGRRWDASARENLQAELALIDHQLGAEADEDTFEPEQRERPVLRTSAKMKRSRLANQDAVAAAVQDPPAENLAAEDLPEGVAAAEGVDEDDFDEADAGAADDTATTSTLETIPDLVEELRRRKRS